MDGWMDVFLEHGICRKTKKNVQYLTETKDNLCFVVNLNSNLIKLIDINHSLSLWNTSRVKLKFNSDEMML